MLNNDELLQDENHALKQEVERLKSIAAELADALNNTDESEIHHDGCRLVNLDGHGECNCQVRAIQQLLAKWQAQGMSYEV